MLFFIVSLDEKNVEASGNMMSLCLQIKIRFLWKGGKWLNYYPALQHILVYPWKRDQYQLDTHTHTNTSLETKLSLLYPHAWSGPQLHHCSCDIEPVCVCCVSSVVWSFENHNSCRYFSLTVPFLFNSGWLKGDKERETVREREPGGQLVAPSLILCVVVCVCVQFFFFISVCVRQQTDGSQVQRLGPTPWGLLVPCHPHNVNHCPWSCPDAFNTQEEGAPLTNLF